MIYDDCKDWVLYRFLHILKNLCYYRGNDFTLQALLIGQFITSVCSWAV
jgi:hypothetical protein